MRQRLTIGEAARRSGVTAKAIRFYEASGILPPAPRGSNGYRLYDGRAVEVLRFVRRASGLGLSLAQIRDIVAIRQGGRPPCAHVRRLLEAKLQELEERLRDLHEMRRRIHQSLRAWERHPVRPGAVCPHIEQDSSPPEPARVRSRGAPPAGAREGARRGGRLGSPPPGRRRRRREGMVCRAMTPRDLGDALPAAGLRARPAAP
jgi:DNA-binding transcriptional MerR regulator